MTYYFYQDSEVRIEWMLYYLMRVRERIYEWQWSESDAQLKQVWKWKGEMHVSMQSQKQSKKFKNTELHCSELKGYDEKVFTSNILIIMLNTW